MEKFDIHNEEEYNEEIRNLYHHLMKKENQTYINNMFSMLRNC